MSQAAIEGFRLSPQQQQLWRLLVAHAASTSSAATPTFDTTAPVRLSVTPFWSHALLRLSGPLDSLLLKAALRRLVSRHELLRTRFAALPGMALPLQIIGDEAPVPLLSWHEIDERSRRSAHRQLQRVLRDAQALKVEWERGAALQAAVIGPVREATRAEWWIVLSLPALYGDGRGMSNVGRELGRCYQIESHSEMREAEDVEVVQYADLSEWQNELIEAEETATGRQYWAEQASRNGTEEWRRWSEQHQYRKCEEECGGMRPAQVRIRLGAGQRERLVRAAAAAGVEVREWVLACWALMWHRLSAQSQIAIGTRFDGRRYEGLSEVPGLLAKYVPLHVSIGAGVTMAEMAQEVAGRAKELRKWQEYYADDAMADVTGGICYSFAEEGWIEDFGSVRWTSEWEYECARAYRLKLVCEGGRDGTLRRLDLHYDRSRFNFSDAARIGGYLRTLLIASTTENAGAVSCLPLLSERERRRVIEEVGRGEQLEKSDCVRVQELFEQQVERTPHAVAVVYEQYQVTYEELNRRANKVAHRLRMMGAGPETLVGLLLERSVEMVVAILGVLKAGSAYVPLDAGYPDERLRYVVDDAAIRVLLTQRNQQERAATLGVEHVLCLDSGDAEHLSEENPVSSVSGENLCYVIYTSGSTGGPKGVMVTHNGLTNYLQWSTGFYRVSDGDGSVVHSSIGFDLTVTSLFPALLKGRPLFLVPEEGAVEELAEILKRGRNQSLLKLTPTHLDVLRHLLADEEVAGRTRAFVIGGEALKGEQLRYWREQAPATRLINEYGPTETVVGCCIYEVKKTDELDGNVPIGRPIANTQLYVLDEWGELVGVGMKGELYIGGAGVARGYVKRPELTAERFVPDAFSSEAGARLYRTGDLARYRADGELEYLGRIDNQVKIRGYRIELGEIEAALCGVAGVREAVVVARVEAQGEQRLVAYVVLAAEQAGMDQGARLRRELAARLPDYMVPAAIVELAQLPLTANGKVDRRALPEPARSRKGSERTAARTPEEELLCGIWAEVLGVERVGIDENFFELGGDSILSIQIVARAARAGLRLLPKSLFQYQTVASLAAIAERVAAPVQEELSVAPEPLGPLPLTPIQQRFFALHRTATHHWNQSVLLRVRQPLTRSLLEQIVAALLRQHDALRLRFAQDEAGNWRQWYGEYEETEAARVVQCYDLSGQGLEEARRRLEEAGEQLQGSLELGAGPLLRVGYFELGEEERRLLLTIHHLAVDGVTWRILLEDLERAYEQASSGGAVELGAKTSAYGEWARRLSEYARSERLEAETEYWLQQAEALRANSSNGSSSNRSGRRAVEGSGQWAEASGSLTEEQTRGLLQEVGRAYGTRVTEVLLAGLLVAWEQWSGERVLGVDVEVHGREAELVGGVDVTRTAGWFTGVYPLVLALPGEWAEAAGEYGAVLKSVKEQLRAVPGGGLGYGLLRYLGRDETVRRRLAAGGEARVSFNYLGQFDGVLGGSEEFAAAWERAGRAQAAESEREHELSVGASVGGGRLRVSVGYEQGRYAVAEIEQLVAGYVRVLGQLVEHCQTAGVGGYTPSDFPLINLGQSQLDQLVGSGRHVQSISPLSPIQEGLLFQTLYAPEAGVYFEQLSCVIRGDINVGAFEQAWQQLIERHTILRTAFVWKNLEKPLQVVRRHAKLPLRYEDWRSISQDEQTQGLEEFLAADRQSGFDLSAAPLMRIALLRVDEDSHRFVWSHHHLLLDGWSLQLLMSEVFDLYRALCRDEKVSKDKARPFEDYIAWLQRRDATEAETFWRETLQGFTSPTIIARRVKERELQIDQGYGELRALLPKSVTAQLQQMARSHQLTLNTVVQGAWALLLSRYSGESDVVFGATSSGRPAEIDDIESMVGLFINTLPVRVRIDEERKLDEWLRELQAQQAEMRQFEYSSLVEVQGWSEVPRGVALFESLLAFENYPVDVALRESVQQSGVEVDDVRFTEATHYPLTVIIGPGAQLLVKIIYERSRYDNLTTERMLKHFVTLLERMATEPVHRVLQLELLTDAERQTLIEVWNETQADYPTDKCLHEVFEEQSARTPDAVALVFDDQYLSYGQLNARANQIAHRLRKIGVGPEMLVAILAERGIEMLVGVLGVLKAGGAYVPLDPAYPPERLKLMLEDSGAVALLTTGQRAAELPENGMRVLRLDAAEAIGSTESKENPRPTATADNLLYVIYTSGSTGRPKGVAMRHGPLTNLITWQTHRATPSPARTLQFTSLSFDVSFQEIFTTWCAGGTLIMISEETRRDAERLLNLIVDAEVERLFLPFVALQQLAETAARKELSSARLREVLTAGEQLQVTARVIEMFSKLPGSSLHNQYGPAEAHVVTALTLEGSPQLWPSLPPIGRPVDNAHMYVLDARLRPVPVEVTGELYIGGDVLARGYLNRPDLTAERFIPDPFGAERGARLYRTGDSASYLQDGQIEFLGRSDQQLKIRGFRIELGEIETVIATHEAVREAVVTADVLEGGTKRLIAYLVLHPGAQPSMSEVRRFLAERLPGHMVPSAFVKMDQLPLTPSGKVNRRALPAASTFEREVKERTTVARSEVEELLCGTVAQCLQIEHAGPDDNYFELGGHSLLATQVISRIREAFGVELPLRALFESQTIADMADRIDELLRARCGTTVQPIQPLEREGILPASFAQQRLWFLDQLEPNSALYNIPTAVRMQGRLDVTALERTLNEIVRRHEVLRTSFETFKGQPVQVITPAVDVALPRIDLKGLDPAEQESVVRELSSAEARRPFDLSRDLLVRATLLQLGDEDHVVLFTMHHIISDGWSMGVFIKEVTALYDAFSENRPSPLPSLPVQYADFAMWQKEWMQGEVLERQLSYWKKQLGGSPSLVRLPTDRPRLAKLDHAGALLSFALPADASRSLKSCSRQRNVTLFMMLLAAFKTLLHSYSGQTDLLVGTPVANRNLTETEPLIGFFVNTLVMRTDLSGNPTFGEILSRVREVVIQAHTNQDLPFEKLVAELQSERDWNRSPLFNVWFVLQNAPMSPLSLPGLTLSPMPSHSGTARYDLKLDLWESPEGLTGSFEYKAHLFSSETIARISRNLEILLRYLPGHPDARLDELRQVLAEADKQHLTIKGREFTEARRQKLKNLQRQPRVTYSLSSNAD